MVAQAANQLADSLTIVRLSLHVLSASVWVGGQLVLAGLVPTVRRLGSDAPRQVARAFGRLNWPAYWLLVATGFWNVLAVHANDSTAAWKAVLTLKVAAVAVAGIGAYLHTKAPTARGKGIWAGVGMMGTLAALVLGVALAG